MLTVSAERLCMHDSSFYFQNSHPYPCFTPDGKHVLYASDIEGYIILISN